MTSSLSTCSMPAAITAKPGTSFTGMANGILLTVVYTERGERTRIISARKATRYEQREYYDSQTAE
jgi:uncharacterized DUF497 family protein